MAKADENSNGNVVPLKLVANNGPVAVRDHGTPWTPWTPPDLPDVERSIADLCREARLRQAQIGLDNIQYSDDESDVLLAEGSARIDAIFDELSQRAATQQAEASALLGLVAEKIEEEGEILGHDFTCEVAILRAVLSWVAVSDNPNVVARLAEIERDRQAGRCELASEADPDDDDDDAG